MSGCQGRVRIFPDEVVKSARAGPDAEQTLNERLLNRAGSWTDALLLACSLTF